MIDFLSVLSGTVFLLIAEKGKNKNTAFELIDCLSVLSETIFLLIAEKGKNKNTAFELIDYVGFNVFSVVHTCK